ncbi:MAG: S8 family serine peptidase, partial [Chloroflexi bacterium]|nr:S8 family serine peptidase [Chloroflexota bacterium]
MQPQTHPQAHSDRRAPNRKRMLALGLGVAGGLTAILVGVATARPAEPFRPSGPEVATDLRATLETEPAAAAILMLDAPAADDRAIARAQALALAALGADFVPSRQYAHVPALAGRLHREALTRLAAVPGLVAVSGDPELHAFLDDSTKFIGSDRLRLKGVTGSGVNVAVIDTGVDATHIDLRDAVVAQLCTLVPRDRCGSGDNPASDLDGHGTHVAGMVGSRGKRAGYGVASGAGIIAVKYLEARATGAGSDMIEALDL